MVQKNPPAKKIIECKKCGHRFYTRNIEKPVECPSCKSLCEVKQEPTEEVTTEEQDIEVTTEKQEPATETPVIPQIQDKKLEIKPIKEKTKKMEKETDEYFCERCMAKISYGSLICPSCQNELDWDSESTNLTTQEELNEAH